MTFKAGNIVRIRVINLRTGLKYWYGVVTKTYQYGSSIKQFPYLEQEHIYFNSALELANPVEVAKLRIKYEI